MSLLKKITTVQKSVFNPSKTNFKKSPKGRILQNKLGGHHFIKISKLITELGFWGIQYHDKMTLKTFAVETNRRKIHCPL